MELRKDTFGTLQARQVKRKEQLEYYNHRETKKEEICREYHERNPRILEEEVNRTGLLPIEPEEDMLTEEELAMSFLLTQVEMEASLENDYHSILDASKSMAIELQASIKEFDNTEKKVISQQFVFEICFITCISILEHQRRRKLV
jgi:hypothetical protein